MRKVIASIALALAISTPAAAATDLTFTTNGALVGNVTGAPAPVSSLTGTFSYDFNATTNRVSLTAFSLNVGSATFSLANVGLAYPYFTGPSDLLIGGTLGGVNQIAPGTNDFSLLLYGFDPVTGMVRGNAAVGAPPGFTQLLFSLNGVTNQFFTAVNPVAVTRTSSGAVPEPGTWAMMLLGFGGMGLAFRRRGSLAAKLA